MASSSHWVRLGFFASLPEDRPPSARLRRNPQGSQNICGRDSTSVPFSRSLTTASLREMLAHRRLREDRCGSDLRVCKPSVHETTSACLSLRDNIDNIY